MRWIPVANNVITALGECGIELAGDTPEEQRPEILASILRSECSTEEIMSGEQRAEMVTKQILDAIARRPESERRNAIVTVLTEVFS